MTNLCMDKKATAATAAAAAVLTSSHPGYTTLSLNILQFGLNIQAQNVTIFRNRVVYY